MTIIIILITVIVSVLAFYKRELFHKLEFTPYLIKHNNEWYRFFTYGLLHANWGHLLINMFVLWSFGETVEYFMKYYFQEKAILFFLMLYIGGILFSVLFDFGKHKDNGYYHAVGASGAVASIVFASIFYHPMGKIYFYFIPIGIPSFVFGLLYLVYSVYMARRGGDNIGHNAHFWGAIFGFVFVLLLKPVLFKDFISQIFGG